MTAFQILIKAAGLQTLWLGIASVFAGTAAAAAHGNLEPFPALACMLFAIFAQCTSNVMHRYYNDKHGYGENKEDDIGYAEDINLPLRYILKEGIHVFSILTVTAGLAVMSMAGWWTLSIAALIIVIAVVNNIGPHPLCRTVLYPLATFFIFGPIAVIGTELVQSLHGGILEIGLWDMIPSLIISIITGIMAVNCHIVYGIYHRRKNAVNLRTSFFGRYGWKATTTLLVVNTITYGIVGVIAPWCMNIDNGHIYIFVPVISMALSFVTIHFARKPKYCHIAWKLSLINIVTFAILSLIIFYITGYPSGYVGE